MTVMQRLVEWSAGYAAQQIKRVFKNRLNPAGESRAWVKGETDWFFAASRVPYPCKRNDLIQGFLAPVVGGFITDLEAALAQHPDEKLTFYPIPNETLFEYKRFFRDTDYSAQAVCDEVIVLATGNYIEGQRRIWLNIQTTPLLVRDSNILILPDNPQVKGPPDEVAAVS